MGYHQRMLLGVLLVTCCFVALATFFPPSLAQTVTTTTTETDTTTTPSTVTTQLVPTVTETQTSTVTSASVETETVTNAAGTVTATSTNLVTDTTTIPQTLTTTQTLTSSSATTLSTSTTSTETQTNQVTSTSLETVTNTAGTVTATSTNLVTDTTTIPQTLTTTQTLTSSSATTLSTSTTSTETQTNQVTSTVTAPSSSTEGYQISFYPASDWECGEDIQVTFQGPMQAGHPIQFVYYQYSPSNPSELSPLWTDTQYATGSGSISYTIDGSEWSGFNFASLPYIYVTVQDIDVPTNNPYIILYSAPTSIEPFSCGTGSGYVGYTTYGNCADWEAGQCVQYVTTTQGINMGGEETTQAVSTQTMSVTTTSNFYSTLVATTTGYATTQMSTTVSSKTLYVTQSIHSYGTVTATQYVYMESSNSTPNVYPANSGGAVPGSSLWNPSALASLLNGNNLPSSPILLLVGSGAVFAALLSALVMRRRRGRGLQKSASPSEVDETLLNYITNHNGAISMAKASKDLGMSTEELGEAIMRLRADGKLQGG